jgi:hypothetical protein
MEVGVCNITDKYYAGVVQIKRNNITSTTQIGNNFLKAVSSLSVTEPVKVEGGRIHADEKRMEVDRPYIVHYGKGIFMVRKDSKERIHVYRIP